ncbi:MAG: glycosyltransferase [bacterium]
MFGLRGLHPDLEISGFETAFAEIAPRLVARGHSVTIYCRAAAHTRARRQQRAEGIRLVYVPSPGGKNFSAIISTLLAVLHALASRDLDVWFFVNVGMGYHAALARLSGKPVVMNVDGLDWTRGKWGPIARRYFRGAARAAVRFCTRLVTDAEAMRRYYLEHFSTDSSMIAYGAIIEDSEHPDRIAALGVGPGEYYLVVARLVPENSIALLLEGFTRSRTSRRLVVVGGATYQDAYHTRLRELADNDDRIMMVGHVHDQVLLKELWCNCYAYLHGHSVGGTNPSLLRAMGYARCVIALDTVFNREALADAGRYFSGSEDVTRLLDGVDATGSAVVAMGANARARARELYDWEHVAGQYERLFVETVAGDRTAYQS